MNKVEAEKILFTNEATGAETKYARIVGDRGISFEKAKEIYEQARTAGVEAGFYKGRSGPFLGVIMIRTHSL